MEPAHISKKVYFNYVFNEDIIRVYEAFTHYEIVSEFTLKKYISKIFLPELKYLDQEGLEFSVVWKEVYEMKIIVVKSIKNNNFKSFTHKINIIKEGNPIIFLTYEFFLNSCDQKTLFVLEIESENEAGDKLIYEFFSDEERKAICSNLEQYFLTTSSNLIQYESILIKNSIFKVWRYFMNFSNILPFLCLTSNGEYDLQINGGMMKIGTLINIIEKESNNICCSIEIKTIMMSEERMKIILKTKKNKNHPSYLFKIMIEMLTENSCMLMIKHIFIEYIPFPFFNELGKKKRTTIKSIKTHLDKD